MSNSSENIIVDSKAFYNELENVPFLSEKMLIDTINGLEVAKDHLTYQANQSGMDRFIGFLDGSNKRREMSIKQHQQRSIEGVVAWVSDLTRYGHIQAKALNQAIEKIVDLQDKMHVIAKVTYENQLEIQSIKLELEQFKGNMVYALEHLDKKIDHIGDLNDFRFKIEVMDKAWRSDRRYKGYSPITASVFFLQELVQDDFASLFMKDIQNQQYIVDVIFSVLREKYQIKDTYTAIEHHIATQLDTCTELQNGVLTYLLDHPDYDLWDGVLETNLKQYVPDRFKKMQAEKGLPVFGNVEDLVWTLVKEKRGAYE